MTAPLLELTGVWRSYPAGEQSIDALKGVDLTIEAGEMVAIIGQSGSRKSTLMNVLGCLDRPTKGSYKVAGRDVKKMLPDELAALRREHFGFIFQRYHLLPDLDARSNVEVPAIYSGRPARERRQRASALLGRLGLTDRMHHRPNQLSGGQQQRVSVARALMNGGQVILADEPTGALDTKSGAEMMTILRELNAEGHTIILVTHDPKVAQNARRIIEISDGEIIADYPNTEAPAGSGRVKEDGPVRKESWAAGVDRLGDALRMALLAMNAHRLRTVLTMLGIIIGIASVVSIFAIGAGAQKSILATVQNMGSDTITILPGNGRGDPRAQAVRTLRPSDVDAIASLTFVDSATPNVSAGRTLRFGSTEANGTVSGVADSYFRVQNTKMASGRTFDAEAVRQAAQVVVIDDNTAKKLFPGVEPVGQVILMGATPARIIGVAAKPEGLAGLGAGDSLQIWAPYTTVMARMIKQPDVRQVTVKLVEGAPPAGAEEAITRLLTTRHGGKTDFFLITSEEIAKQVGRITGIFSILLGSIGGISLVVGGIGVMNIMLVSVSERIREIGVRTAVGARRSDIMSQFMIEAILVCLIGGGLGVALAMLIGFVFSLFTDQFTLVYSPATLVAAFSISTLIGLVFGWLPARNAANLDPVDALARE
ncbi:MAG: macrolide transporter permease/ATP-binding protein MacB [Caulobacteraceae bacterium]|nr:macrolide transporter permease/ATP-binding protein MacB [Caulobacteraceae bacterium]